MGYSLVYLLLRLAFGQAIHVTISNMSSIYPAKAHSALTDGRISEHTQIFKLNESMLFPNAYRVKMSIVNTLKQPTRASLDDEHKICPR